MHCYLLSSSLCLSLFLLFLYSFLYWAEKICVLYLTRISRIISLKLKYYIITQLKPSKGFQWHLKYNPKSLAQSTKISPHLTFPSQLLPLCSHVHSSQIASLLFFRIAKHVPTYSPSDYLSSLSSVIHKAFSLLVFLFLFSSLLQINKSSWTTILFGFSPKWILRPGLDEEFIWEVIP